MRGDRARARVAPAPLNVGPGCAILVNHMVQRRHQQIDLDAAFAALADPTRRAILARLASGPATVKELSAPFEMSGPAVSKHLRVLERAGLITRGRDAQFRPAQLDATPLKEVAEWADKYRRFWDASYERLDEYLRDLQRQEKNHGRSTRK